MPADAPKTKRDATLALGAEVVSYDRMTESREKIAAHLAHARGATLVPSFDDAWIIEGQGSAGIEATTQFHEAGLAEIEHVVTPCGGGGLASGLALALPDADITIVEPLRLSKDQLKDLDRIAEEGGQREMQQWERDTLTAVYDLKTVLDKEKPSTEEIISAGERVRSLRSQVSERQYKLLAAERQVLTQKQWQRLQDQLQER